MVSEKRPFLTAEWQNLAIANFEVDPDLLKSFVPAGTEIDFYDQKCLISLVAFQFINTKVLGVRVPYHSDFEEINLRFYVRRKENGLWRRGVTFIREIVPKYAITIIANSLYQEKYITLPTRHSLDLGNYSLRHTYQWKYRNQWNTFSVAAGLTTDDLIPGSLEEFITEHYWGYTKLNAISTTEYQVDHPRWEMHSINSYHIDVEFEKLYGTSFKILNQIAPQSIMLAKGSPVVVLGKRKI